MGDWAQMKHCAEILDFTRPLRRPDTDYFAKSAFVRKHGKLHTAHPGTLERARETAREQAGNVSALKLSQRLWRSSYSDITPFDEALDAALPVTAMYAARTGPGRVYFLLCDGFCKIGFATCVSIRHAAIQASNPNEVIVAGHVYGTLQDERALHKRFADLRGRGEWFRYEGALRDYVEGLSK